MAAIFSIEMQERAGKPYVKDSIRRKWILLTPEEEVRLQLIHYIVNDKGIAPGRLGIERGIRYEGMQRRFDVVVFDRQGAAWVLCECKAPEVPLSKQTLAQVARYNRHFQAPHWLITNGRQWALFSRDAAGTYQFNPAAWPEGQT